MMRTMFRFIVLGATASLATADLISQERPRLVVLCSVDQLASWVHRIDHQNKEGE